MKELKLMAKHSFASKANSFRIAPQKDPRFIADHEEPDIGEIRYLYTYGPLNFTQKHPLSQKFAILSIILFIASVILWLNGYRIQDASFKYASAISFASFCNFLMIRYSEKTPEREAKNAGKIKKNWVPLAAGIGFPAFLLVPIGLFWYSDLGIFSGIFVFVGSAVTLTAFGFLNNAEHSDRSFGLRELFMVLMFIPATISLFGFGGIILGFILQFQ